MMTSFYYRLRKAHDIDGHAIVGGVDQSQIKTQLGHLAYAKVYTVVPLSHFSGMAAALQGGVFLFSILVLGPSMKPPTPPLVTEILQYSGAKAFVAMPSLLRAMCQNPSTVEALKSLDFVQWIGAALDSATGSTLSQITRISPAMGTTECGPYFLITPEESKDWEYYIFQEGQGIEFIKREGGLFELVFRKYSNAGWQQVFEVYPNLEVYETKDLFMKHPEKEGFWAYAGRSDDMVVLSNSANINAAAVEEKLMQHPNVQVALVGGSGRDHSFAIISLASVAREQIPSNDPDAALNLVWPAVEHANKGLSDYSKLKRNFILIVEEGLVVGPKGTVLRGPSLKLFADKINALFVNK